MFNQRIKRILANCSHIVIAITLGSIELSAQIVTTQNADHNSTTITVGDMQWKYGNLDVSTFSNGDSILYAETEELWRWAGENKIPAWCYPKNDSTDAKCGKLYNGWAITDKRGIAPNGWHIPSKVEWEKLFTYAQSIKNIVFTHQDISTDSLNNSRMILFKAGKRDPDGVFTSWNTLGCYWSRTVYNKEKPYGGWAGFFVDGKLDIISGFDTDQMKVQESTPWNYCLGVLAENSPLLYEMHVTSCKYGLSVPLVSDDIIEVNKSINPKANSVNLYGEDVTLCEIGGKVWFAENLKVKQFRNGDLLKFAKDKNEFGIYTTMKVPAYHYPNFDLKQADNSGYYYNWYAVIDPRGLAPEGWNIPSQSDCLKLIDALGPEDFKAQKLMSTKGWKSSKGLELFGTDEFGFNALPDPERSANADLISAAWWTCTPAMNGMTSYIFFMSGYSSIGAKSTAYISFDSKPIRCIQE